MASFARSRIKRLERSSKDERSELVCGVCGWKVTVYGAWEMDLMALDWLAHQDEPDEHSAFSPHPGVLALHGHEHPAEDFVERRVS